jgi:hypothetical protein
MEAVLGGLGHALSLAFAMLWEILWALILGFALSGVVQAVVPEGEMSRLLPDDSPARCASRPDWVRPPGRARMRRWRRLPASPGTTRPCST